MPDSRMADLDTEARDRFDQLAREVRDKLSEDPTRTVDQLAEALDASHEEVAFVLDEYAVDGGEVVHMGPGQGGGWTPQPEPPEAAPEVRTPHDSIEQDLADGVIDENEAKRRHAYVEEQAKAAKDGDGGE